jgi:hypothetical protein
VDTVIVPKLYTIMRTLLRDSITDKKWLRTLLSEWLAQKGMGQHIQWVYTIFEELVSHDDLQYELNEYREWGAIYRALLQSRETRKMTGTHIILHMSLYSLEDFFRVLSRPNTLQKFDIFLETHTIL